MAPENTEQESLQPSKDVQIPKIGTLLRKEKKQIKELLNKPLPKDTNKESTEKSREISSLFLNNIEKRRMLHARDQYLKNNPSKNDSRGNKEFLEHCLIHIKRSMNNGHSKISAMNGLIKIIHNGFEPPFGFMKEETFREDSINSQSDLERDRSHHSNVFASRSPYHIFSEKKAQSERERQLMLHKERGTDPNSTIYWKT